MALIRPTITKELLLYCLGLICFFDIKRILMFSTTEIVSQRKKKKKNVFCDQRKMTLN
jgi:protein-tyrosine phosphatase